jgi:hypothetical protein
MPFFGVNCSSLPGDGAGGGGGGGTGCSEKLATVLLTVTAAFAPDVAATNPITIVSGGAAAVTAIAAPPASVPQLSPPLLRSKPKWNVRQISSLA